MIFDYDGTLIESRADKGAHLLQALTKFGCPANPERFAEAWGKPFRDMVKILSPKAEMRFASFLEFYAGELSKAPPRACAGVAEAIPALMALGPLFVHSSSHSFLIRHELELIGIVRAFEFVCGSDWQSRSKPHPESLAPILELLSAGGYRRSDCIYVGDSPADRALAVAAGIDFVGAGFARTTADALLAAAKGPIPIARSMHEVRVHVARRHERKTT
jgi:phosphoglycolate phosphatase-like HAD superfamily hydrolase